jgi:long-chain acyl-CoA synthetase
MYLKKVSSYPSHSKAISIKGKSISYGELVDKIDHFNQQYSGDQLPLVLRASRNLDFIASYLSRLANNQISIVLSDQLTPEEQDRCLRQLNYYRLSDEQCMPSEEKNNPTGANFHTHLNTLLFTSGTSGVPKGVQLSQENIYQCLKAIIENLGFKDIQEQLLFLPLSYSYGLLGQLLTGLYCGHHITIQKSLVELNFALPQLSNDTMISGVPEHFATLIELNPNKQFPAIKRVLSAGGFLKQQTREAMTQLFPHAILYNNYGQTEMSPRALFLDSRDPDFFTNKTGRPIGKMEAKIVDGEIYFRGPHIMLGYIGETEKTRGNKFNGDWLRTGDLASKDENGVYSILGRQDQLIKISGERVSILEIEQALTQLTSIQESACLLLSNQGQEDKLVAILVPRAGQSLKKVELVKELANKLSKQKIPKVFYQINDIPKNENGKMNRKELSRLIDHLVKIK